jgi:hypothetical protein
MSTSLSALPNDAHPTATPVQSQPSLGINNRDVNAVVDSLGHIVALPTRDIPTVAAAMFTDAEVQPNHVTVDRDYISRLSNTGDVASDRRMVTPPDTHDIYLLPVTAALAVLLLTLRSSLSILRKYLPKRFWENDGTPSMMFDVLRAAVVGGAVWAVDGYF